MDETITLIEAVGLLAGRTVHSTRDKARYDRHAARLRTAVRRGDIGSSLTATGRVYSRADVQALKDALSTAGVGDRPAAQRRHVNARAQARQDGLVNSATARELVGVSRSMPDYWGRRGWYGARKIAGEWFFERNQLPTGPRYASREPMRLVTCSRCRVQVERRASRVRETIARGGLFYCGDCWTQQRDGVLRESKRGRTPPVPSVETREKMAAARRREWAEGERDRERAAATIRTVATALRKSPTRHVEQIEKMRSTRGLSPLSPERRAELARNARRRGQRPTGRANVASDLQREVSKLWPTGKPVREIAAALGTSESNVKQIRRRLGLPERSRGRRRTRE